MTVVSTSSRVSELATALANGGFPWESKAEMLAASKEYWNPGKTQFWLDEGVPLSSTGARATTCTTSTARR